MDEKHSGLGIASFITSVISIILLFAALAIGGAIEVTTPGGMDEDSTEAVLIGLGIIFVLLLALTSFGLGMAGIFQKDCKRIFAILGTVFSATIILATIALVLFGLSLE